MFSSSSAQTEVAMDVHSLNSLRSLAQRDKGQALDKAAQQFEALFIQMMLKSARAGGFGDPLFDSNQMDFYRDMFDQQLAVSMAETGSVGIGDMLLKQMQGPAGKADNDKADTPNELQPMRRFIGSPTPIYIPDSTLQPADTEKNSDKHIVFNSPEDFVEKLRPYAEEAAKKLGVSPKVLLAQAALETGWGKHISKDSEGQSSLNLFNIKANKRWAGKTLAMNTMEYINGKFIKENASFRAYDGFADSFSDYVDFLKSNPRYGDAIAQANNDIAFTKALQGAGYATDPDYSSKITRVLGHAALAEAFGGLKFSDHGSLTSKDG